MITANHKPPGDPRACDGCSRKGRETYILAIGDKELALCHTCTPIVIEKLSAIGVDIEDPKLEACEEELSEVHGMLDESEAELKIEERHGDDLREENTKLRDRIAQLEAKQAA